MMEEKFLIDHEGKPHRFDEADIATLTTKDWAIVRISNGTAQAETDSEPMVQHVAAFVDGRGLTEVRWLYKGKTSRMIKRNGEWTEPKLGGTYCVIILLLWTCYQLWWYCWR